MTVAFLDCPVSDTPHLKSPSDANLIDLAARWIIFVAVVITTGMVVFTPGFVSEVFQSLWRREAAGGLLNPVIIATAILVFLWERYWPVGGRKISPAAQLTDLGWWMISGVSAVGFPIAFAALTNKAASAVAPATGEPFDLLGGLPWWLRYALAILLIDFFRYLVHVLRHKIPWLWRFHATHHSTHELNQFSAYRQHPVDYAVGVAVAAVPFSLFQIPVEGFVMYQIAIGMLGRTHHAAVAWHWPVLNWIFVSPRIHRIHHSSAEECYDKNFGLTFSIWDRLFGTYMEPETEDPTPSTGVPGFKNVEANSILEVPEVLVKQLMAPFRRFDAQPNDD